MNREEIRAEAIERIARSLFEARRRSSDPDWADPRVGFAWLWRLRRDEATRLVDTLGDLLPIGTEERIGVFSDDRGRIYKQDRRIRYVTEWQREPK